MKAVEPTNNHLVFNIHNKVLSAIAAHNNECIISGFLPFFPDFQDLYLLLNSEIKNSSGRTPSKGQIGFTLFCFRLKYKSQIMPSVSIIADLVFKHLNKTLPTAYKQ